MTYYRDDDPFGPDLLTRNDKRKPKTPKPWAGRVVLRQIAKGRTRSTETRKSYNLRQRVRALKRIQPRRARLKSQRMCGA